MHAVCRGDGEGVQEGRQFASVLTGDTNTPLVSVALQPRSLLVFRGDAYTHCLHGIDEVCSLFSLLVSSQGDGESWLDCLG